MKKLVFSILLSGLMVFSCTNEDDAMNVTDCPSDIGCTEVFISLTFSPKDDNDQAILLDSFYAQNLDNGNTYSIPATNLLNTTSYTVISDAEIDEINKDGTNIRFIGLQGDQIVVQQDFVVGHDCCHVLPISGPFDGQ